MTPLAPPLSVALNLPARGVLTPWLKNYLKRESQLQSKFGTKVALAQSRKKGSGKIEIPYSSTDDLTRILELLNISLD